MKDLIESLIKTIIVILLGFIICYIATATPAKAGIIADTLYMEARGEGELGMRAVATVIYNRAKGDVNKLEAVCLAPKQFSCWNNRSKAPLRTKASDIRAYSLCLKIEQELKAQKFYPIGNWTHYHTKDITPYWNKNRKGELIGNHIFLKIR